MSSALSLLVNPGIDSIWLVGTRWALWDVYSEWMKVYGDKLGRLVRAVIEDGEPIWPERFTPEVIALKRQAYGDEYKFSCLMMNNPRNPELQDLNVEDFKFWSWSGDKRVALFDKNGLEVDRWDLSDLDITCTVDLAAAEKITSDRNAITTVGVSPKNQAIVLDAWGKRCTPLEVIQKLFSVHRRFHPRVYGIEDVGYQKSLKDFVREAAKDAGIYLNVVPVKPGGKGKPHIKGLQPLMATGRIFIHPTQHLLRNEAADYPLGEHDDVLDSLALHQQLFRSSMSQERWAKYKESERKLLHALKHPGQRLIYADPRKGILDLEEMETEHSDVWQEVSLK
jgi:predicted phage terminase large subunit-like protein